MFVHDTSGEVRLADFAETSSQTAGSSLASLMAAINQNQRPMHRHMCSLEALPTPNMLLSGGLH